MSAGETAAAAAVIDGGVVGRFAAELDFDALPETVRERARQTLRDTLGTLVGGRETLAAQAAAAAALADGSSGPVRLVAAQGSAGRTAGALANGVCASCLDFDDGHVLGGSIHPAGAIVPALLATAAGRDVTVEDLLAALVVAYEVAIRAGYLLWPEDRSHQAHLAGTPAAIGGAVGCARLLSRDAGVLRRAMEIGWAHAPLARLQFPMVKESLGWAAATAVAAAELAVAGFKLAGPQGNEAFAYAAHPPTGFDTAPINADPFVTSLGSRWELEQTYFKPYSACRFTHTAADALLELRAEHEVAPESIESILVATHREAAYLDGRRPATIEAAQYSFPWVVAVAAVEGEVTPRQVRHERLDDPAFVEMAARVTVEHDTALDPDYPEAYPSRVTLNLRDGRELSALATIARGAPERPLSEDELRAKFRALVEPALGAAGADALERAVAGDGPVEQVLDLVDEAGAGA